MTSQGKVDIDNQNIVILATTDENNKNSCKTIYEAVYEKYLKSGKIFTNKFLLMCNTKPNEQQNNPN